MNKQRLIPDPVLNEVFEKAFRCSEMAEFGISENSVAYLITEEIDESDVKSVRRAIASARKQMDALDTYIGSLNIASAELGGTDDYIKDLKNALDTAQGDLAAASLETGMLSSFFGEKVTLPQIAQAAIALHTKAQDFGKALEKSINVIQGQLAPMVTDETLKTKPLKDVAGQGGVPTEEKLRQGFQKALSKSLGGGAWNKVKSFFAKGTRWGAEKKIMDALPQMDPNQMSFDIADAFMNATFQDLSQEPPPTPNAPPDLQATAEEAVEAEAAAAPPTEDAAAEEGLSAEETAAADQEAAGIAGELGSGPISKKELTAMLKKYPGVGGAGAKATRHRRIFRNAINQAAGTTVFEEQVAMLKRPALVEVLLPVKSSTDERVLPTEDDFDDDRWLELAGLEKK